MSGLVTTASPTPITDDLAVAPDDLFLYPIPEIYTGDRVTIQVFPQVPEDVAVESVTLHIYVDGKEVAVSQLGYGSLASKPQAVIEWAKTNRPQELNAIYPKNQMRFNEEMAKRWVILLKEWKAAIGC